MPAADENVPPLSPAKARQQISLHFPQAVRSASDFLEFRDIFLHYPLENGSALSYNDRS
jgi:hypothetical protein